MTEEQIKQNAEDWVKPLIGKEDGGYNENDVSISLMKNAFMAGAHSRDEEIAYLTYRLNDTTEKLQTVIAERDNLRNPWISVEDRLPQGENNPDEYNAPHRARSSSDVIITDGSTINRGYYSYARMRWEWNEGEINVTHWMPIPQIEKGE